MIVEDEKAILRGLTDLFIYHGFEVISKEDGQQGLQTALSEKFDCILLDVMLPTMNGFDICNTIRQHSRSQPIIMLTAKSSEQDIINGLTMGADDYIAKPFSIEELLLRVNNLLRRSGWSDDKAKIILGDNLILDTDNLLLAINDKVEEVTRREADLLHYLSQQHKPMSREQILADVWGHQFPKNLDTRTVDIHIAKLRKKIEDNPKEPSLIVTYRGEGYKLVT